MPTRRTPLGAALLLVLGGTAHAATITVTTGTDLVADDEQCSLREAVANANNDAATNTDCAAGSGADSIQFAAGVTATTLVGSEISIFGPLTITGVPTTLTAAPNSRIFNVTANVPLTLDRLTLTGGAMKGWGGAVYSQGAVSLINSVISKNSSQSGGGIYAEGAVSLTNSTVSNNSSSSSGGGIASEGAVSLTNSTVSGNAANGEASGGGIYSEGDIRLTNSTLSENQAGDVGGGIYSGGNVILINSTISGNSAYQSGGGLFTFSGNSAYQSGGGLYTFCDSTTCTVQISNTIITGNITDGSPQSSKDIGIYFMTGVTINAVHSLLGTGIVVNGTNTSNIFSDAPQLGPLANNGGPTQTRLPLAGSPALNTGDNTICANSPVSGLDQRGVTRPQPAGGVCDIGAVEAEPAPAPAGITVTPTSGLITTEAGGTATFTVVLNSAPAANVTIQLSSSDLTEGTVSPLSLTFTSANWNTPQTVTVTGVDDALVDGDVLYQIMTTASSADAAYNGLNVADVSVTNRDNDMAPPPVGGDAKNIPIFNLWGLSGFVSLLGLILARFRRHSST